MVCPDLWLGTVPNLPSNCVCTLDVTSTKVPSVLATFWPFTEMNEANRQKVAMRVMPWGLGSRVLGLTRSGERRAVVDEPMGVVRVAPEHTRVKPRSTKRKRVEV